MPIPRDARNEHNREAVELYLTTSAMKLTTRPPEHPDEYHGRNGKPGPRSGQDDDWLQAISSPDCRRTDLYLRGVLKDLSRWHPDQYDVLHTVYLGPSADEMKPVVWVRTLQENGGMARNPGAAMHLHLLEDAMLFIVYRLHRDRRIIYWPAPDEARAYNKGQGKKRREAIYHFFRAVDSGYAQPDARRIATNRAKCSMSALSYWLRLERNKEGASR